MKPLTTIVVSLTLVAAAPAQPQKKRVAVMNFDYATVKSGVQEMFGSNQDVGKGIADILVDKLVASGVYSIIERTQIDKVIAEQNFANSDRADANSAAKIGRVLGIDYILIGSITQFGSDDKKTDVKASDSHVPAGFRGVGMSKSESKAVVQLTARLIDTSTAEILVSAQGRGEDSRKGTGILGGGGKYSGMAAGSLDMKSSNFENTILGAAVNKAVGDIAPKLDEKAASLPDKVVTVDGLVAAASADGVIVVNVGAKAGVKVGDTLEIRRETSVVKDPVTGKVIRRMTDAVGSLHVTETDAQSSVGKFSGPGRPKVGDVVSSPK